MVIQAESVEGHAARKHELNLQIIRFPDDDYNSRMETLARIKQLAAKEF